MYHVWSSNGDRVPYQIIHLVSYDNYIHTALVAVKHWAMVRQVLKPLDKLLSDFLGPYRHADSMHLLKHVGLPEHHQLGHSGDTHLQVLPEPVSWRRCSCGLSTCTRCEPGGRNPSR
jgi:hypothetical protein